jgi:outer membrane protein assembly factor BamB
MMQTNPMRTRLGRTARLAAAALTGGVLAVTAGCSGSGGGGTPAGPAPPVRTLAPDPGGAGPPDAAWPTYGHDAARSGVAPGVAAPGQLTVSWRVHLDGAVYGQPLLIGRLVIAATENDSVYALDQGTGQVDQADVCEAYGAAAVQGRVVYEPCAQGGLAAIGTAGNKIRVRWRGPPGAQGSPVIGGGAVWVTDYQAGRLYELDPATGATRASLRLGASLPHFSSMSMSGHRAYLGTMDGVIAVGGV